jgi:quercetin dioxygenase-like cupin family protein
VTIGSERSVDPAARVKPTLRLAAAVGGVLVLAFIFAATEWLGVQSPMQSDAAGGAGSAAARPATVVKPVSCEKLPNVPGKSVTTAVVEFPPNAYTPAHRHPGSVTAYVLKGAIRSQMDGGPATVYQQGQTWFEPPGALHAFAENASATEPAELLAVFVADNDCGPLVVYEH